MGVSNGEYAICELFSREVVSVPFRGWVFQTPTPVKPCPARLQNMVCGGEHSLGLFSFPIPPFNASPSYCPLERHKLCTFLRKLMAKNLFSIRHHFRFFLPIVPFFFFIQLLHRPPALFINSSLVSQTILPLPRFETLHHPTQYPEVRQNKPRPSPFLFSCFSPNSARQP